MELSQYLRILRKRWWIILVAIMATIPSAWLFSRLQTPVYQSTVEVIILPARPDLGLTQSTQWLLRSYMTVADSNDWAADVIERLQLDMTPEQLRSDVRFAAVNDRMVISIEVESTDGEQANRIARTWATLLMEWRDSDNQRQRKEDRVYAQLRDQPSYTQSWPPRTMIILAAGAAFGVLIAAVVIFFLEWVESGIVRSASDIERWIGVAVLGSVPPSER